MSIKFSEPAVAIQELSYQKISDDLAYFELSSQVSIGGKVRKSFKQSFGARTIFGFSSMDSILSFESDKKPEIPIKSELYVMPKEFRRTLASNGLMKTLEILSFHSLVHQNNYLKDFISHEVTEADIYHIDISSHMAFDRSGTVLSTPIHFTYIDGNMRDGCYELKKASEILSNHSKVLFSESLRRENTIIPKTGGPGKIIPVPYYNISPGCSECLSFFYYPSDDDMIAIWDKCKSYESKYPSTMFRQAIFDLDLLGLREGGAAKFDDYNKSVEYAENYDDNDEDMD